MDIFRVINLGHKAEQPLIRLPSELVDGFEPHGTILPRGTAVGGTADAWQGGRVYPGWCGWVGTWGGLYRVLPSRGHLRLIYGIYRVIRFIRPFD